MNDATPTHTPNEAQAARRRYWNIVVPLLILASENDERRRRLAEVRQQWPGAKTHKHANTQASESRERQGVCSVKVTLGAS